MLFRSVKVLVSALCLTAASAFVAPASKVSAPKTVVKSTPGEQPGGFMPMATETFAKDFPVFNSYGWGVSTKAERWNGRHAMFGWLVIIATSECQKWGLFPDGAATTALTYKDWGGLAQLGFGQYISNERAIIMIAHMHALGVSYAAAFGPQVLGDTLTLLDGEEDEEPYGLFPPFKGQSVLTPAAEMYNGRMAMMGLIMVVATSMASGKDILEVVDIGTGGLLGH